MKDRYYTQDLLAAPGGGNRSHVTAAVAAVILSIALHVGLLIMLPALMFRFPVLNRDYKRDPLHAKVRLADVMTETPDALDWAEIKGADEVAEMLNLPAAARELAVAPDATVMEPPPITDEPLTGGSESVLEPSAAPDRAQWEPRQDILSVDAQVAVDEIEALPRLEIPAIERVADAPDILSPVARDQVGVAEVARTDLGMVRPVTAEIVAGAAVYGSKLGARETALDVGEAPRESATEVFSEPVEDITPFRPIEDFLRASIETYESLRDFRHGYFRVQVQRSGSELLPVVPKDVLLVQDSSASMSEQRLYFCRQALERCLGVMGPNDRFNVVSFRDRATFCFDDWKPNTPGARTTAQNFVRALRSGGNTDIYGSMQELLNCTREPGRPVVAILVSDGVSTIGMTDSTEIIGRFTKQNDGAMSVFSMGTTQKANAYLLDLISTCNRGDSRLVQTGRWGIPDELTALVESINRPVLSGVQFYFAGDGMEVYPVLTSNLYLDKPLVLYGRYPRGTEGLVFQVFGDAEQARCDMVFELPINDASRGKDKAIREGWARNKLYHLLGEYARRPSAEINDDIRKTSRAYNIPIPHRGKF